MRRSNARGIAGLALVPCPLILFAVLLPACSRTVAANYPGNNLVQYPWRSCGMGCDRAFTELESTHDPNGQGCQELVEKAINTGGSDDRVAAAALYDSALLLILQGKGDEAGSRFARAEALDPDSVYKDAEAQYRDAAQRYLAVAPSVTPAAAPPGPALAPAAPSR